MSFQTLMIASAVIAQGELYIKIFPTLHKQRFVCEAVMSSLTKQNLGKIG